MKIVQLALRKPRAAKLGDVLNIDFVGRVEGEEFEGGAAEGHALELGSSSFIPGFEDGLVGSKTDERRDVPVTFPEDYQAAHLAGKLAVFEVTVRDIQEKADASIDDELAKRLGFDDLGGLTDAIGRQINVAALRQLVKKMFWMRWLMERRLTCRPHDSIRNMSLVTRTMNSMQLKRIKTIMTGIVAMTMTMINLPLMRVQQG